MKYVSISNMYLITTHHQNGHKCNTKWCIIHCWYLYMLRRDCMKMENDIFSIYYFNVITIFITQPSPVQGYNTLSVTKEKTKHPNLSRVNMLSCSMEITHIVRKSPQTWKQWRHDECNGPTFTCVAIVVRL